ncbi:redox-sensitive transcriptional activator SoxR [Neptuniibacter pectenicola]|jgi:MerR family redox-sensitive transcriptional activator SoxR|uniref:redox-sensitive transcriptional activator SoxR n=1 Tax=Neptuniibacter pectenicola TaxID=1806669 RepID=UPI000A6CCABC
MMNKKYAAQEELSVGEVSSRSGLPVSTIHFYESKGLISSQRNNGNHRRYKRGVLRKLAVIKVAQKTGIPLEEIKQAMSQLSNDKTITAEDWNNLAEQWRTDLNKRINQLTRLRDILGSCIGCGCLSVDECKLFNPKDSVAVNGPGAYYLDPNVHLGDE